MPRTSISSPRPRRGPVRSPRRPEGRGASLGRGRALRIDAHVHVIPKALLDPRRMGPYMGRIRDSRRIMEALRDHRSFIAMLDEARVEKAFVIPPVAVGQTSSSLPELNEFIAGYCSLHPDRLIPFGTVDPRSAASPRVVLEDLVSRLGVRGIKLHPCHQLFYPNEYRTGRLTALEEIYSFAQDESIPVVLHTGTSVFPSARNVYGDPIFVDDVAVDFPRLRIVIAHGGRPLWTESAFFLVRRHRNVYMDISGIPPGRVLEHFPRLELVAEKTMFGSDWPDPSVQRIAQNIDAVASLPIGEAAKERILGETAREVIGR